MGILGRYEREKWMHQLAKIAGERTYSLGVLLHIQVTWLEHLQKLPKTTSRLPFCTLFQPRKKLFSAFFPVIEDGENAWDALPAECSLRRGG